MIKNTELFLVLYLVIIVLYTFIRSFGIKLSDYLYNSNSTNTSTETLSVVAGNIGAGTIYGIYLFSAKQPLLGFSVSLSYTIGLLLAAALSRCIRRESALSGQQSFIGFLSVRHNVEGGKSIFIWVSITCVFILQLSVQLASVGDVASHIFSTSREMGIIFASLVVGSYIIIGGYKSATVSDHFQAPLVVLTLSIIGVGISLIKVNYDVVFKREEVDYVAPFFAFLMIAPAVFLSVDNWHRIVSAKSDIAAKNGFLYGALICLAGYVIVVFAGSINGEIYIPTEGLSNLALPFMSWIVPAVIVIAIFSIMDTTIPPLIAGLPIKNASLSIMRIYTAILFFVITLTALFFANILQGVVAAFSSLAVFLPPMISALRKKENSKSAFIIGTPISILFAIMITPILNEYALPLSVIFSFILYYTISYLDLKKSTTL